MRRDDQRQAVKNIPLEQLKPFKNHPFQVRDDEEFRRLVESIEIHGVIHPAVARQIGEDCYELISGHRRKAACEVLGYSEMPVLVRSMTDDEAVVNMVDANLQRETILPSERAFAYKMKLVAMSHQGRKGFTSAQLGRKCVGKESRELIAEQVGQSRNQISRYIRLTELIPEILEMVDNRKMALNPAVSISYLDKKQQKLLYKVMVALKATPSISQAKAIREKASESDFTEDYLVCILSEKKPNQREPMIVEEEEIKQYFPSHYNSEQMHNTILLLIRNWSKKRGYPDGWGEAAPLTGLLYCADCGGKMYVHRTNNGKRISQYTCSQYTKVPCGTLCKTQHRINEDVVLTLVSEMLKAIDESAKHDRAEFVRVVQEAQSSQQTAEVRKQRTRLATAKQRVSELEVLLCKIYEDNILGKLSDSRYATLDAQYAKEQAELTDEISALEKAIRSYEKHEKDADRFIALIDKYENFDKLTIAMLNEFIEKILVHERDRKGSIQTTQEVEIYFNFVGRFVPPAFGEVELIPEELEEIRKREERKDRLHQNYLKRKASGAQKRYEDKIKGRKKAEIEAKKAAIRAEDIAKGVFVPVSSLPQREPMKGVQTA